MVASGAARPPGDTTVQEWQRMKGILGDALELPLEQRTAFLDKACGEDSHLRLRLEELIAAHDATSAASLDSPPFPITSADLSETMRASVIGRRIGAYRIEAEIAHGGMGTVFRAVRADDEFKKQVAIKLVGAAAFSYQVAEMFRRERQVLATLEHPNIARLLDGGTTEDGNPYLVMEYVEGEPVSDYCKSHQLSIDDRLSLFRKICSAVHYAHQNLVIHRDIKPANILVTKEGEPKLLDFGIAKVIAIDAVSATLTFGALTPAYASPEQISGEPITTATDVYSLGLVLFELLTGQQAFSSARSSSLRLQKAILEEDLELPSRAALHGSGPDREHESKQLKGDLDCIVAKAVRKARADRYLSAEQFSDDIRRHLKKLPVLAHSDTFRYRISKFSRRHKVSIVAAALIAASLVTGIALTAREARIARIQQARAERRFNDVRKLANSLMFDVHDSIQNLPGATPARKLLVTRALEYLDSLASEAGNDSSLLQELASAYEKVADVQGNPNGANLGDSGGAIANYRKALALRESLAARDRSSTANQQKLASDYQRIGLTLEASTQFNAGLEVFEKALLIHRVLADANPTPENKTNLAGDYFLLAQCRTNLQQPDAALENYRQSVAILESIPDPTPFIESRLAGTYSFMAGILDLQKHDEEATLLQRKSLDLMKKASAAAPGNAMYREFLGEAYYWVGFYYQKENHPANALTFYRQALDIVSPLSAADPKEAHTKSYVAMCNQSIGTILVNRGQTAEGLKDLHRALAFYQELAQADTSGTSGQLSYVADANAALGAAYSHLGGRPKLPKATRIAYWQEARAAYRQSLDCWLLIKKRGVLTAFEIHAPDAITAELAKCDAALAKLDAQNPNL